MELQPAGEDTVGDVIDLGTVGEPGADRDRPRRTWRRMRSTRVSVFVLVLAVLAGAGAATAITYQRQVERRRRADETTVSVLILSDRLDVVISNAQRGELRLAHRL